MEFSEGLELSLLSILHLLTAGILVGSWGRDTTADGGVAVHRQEHTQYIVIIIPPLKFSNMSVLMPLILIL